MNFNPRAPCGARRGDRPADGERVNFNPRAPCGARRVPPVLTAILPIFQSTRPMRGATAKAQALGVTYQISIHAPHAGRDAGAVSGTAQPAISIHAPHAGRDGAAGTAGGGKCYFNPRAPCGARPCRARDQSSFWIFQSTRPMRGATRPDEQGRGRADISIHAPHAGRDRMRPPGGGYPADFNPRAPCGARHHGSGGAVPRHLFQSTRPMRGATRKSRTHGGRRSFQSTRPMRGATPGI